MAALMSRLGGSAGSRAHRKRGFTLVELLVVIGVIAILIGLLLAAVSSVRRQAATVKCKAAMREVAHAFFLYANDYRGYYPVARWVVPAGSGLGVGDLYWSDFVGPYVAGGKFNQYLLKNPDQFARARASVVWGCPSWDGINAELAPSFNINGTSVYENGFTMNPYPTYEADYPSDPTKTVPTAEWTVYLDPPATSGTWYKQNQWTHPAERALVVESTLWVLGFNSVDATRQIPPQRSERGFGIDPRPGANHIDRYRHGRYPTPVNGLYPPERGRVLFNIAFCDGHVESMDSIVAGYRAIRMREP